MPFPTNDLPASPDVRIFFRGQLLLEPQKDGQGNETGKCEIYVNRSAPDHQLSIEVRQKRAGKPDIVMMRHHGPLAFVGEPDSGMPLRHGMFIEIETTKPKVVKKYVGDTTPPPDKSILHAIDFQKIHTTSVGNVDLLSGCPCILLETGTLYTADRTPPDLVIKLVKKVGGTLVKKLEPIASIIGADIDLGDGEGVTIRWREEGKVRKLELKEAPAGSSYEVYINNDPLYEQKGVDVEHQELSEYYKLLPDVATDDRLDLQLPADRGSTTTPCMPVLNGA